MSDFDQSDRLRLQRKLNQGAALWEQGLDGGLVLKRSALEQNGAQKHSQSLVQNSTATAGASVRGQKEQAATHFQLLGNNQETLKEQLKVFSKKRASLQQKQIQLQQCLTECNLELNMAEEKIAALKKYLQQLQAHSEKRKAQHYMASDAQKLLQEHPLFHKKPRSAPGSLAVPITRDFRPTSETLSYLVEFKKIDPDFIQQNVEEFILYWCERAEGRKNWQAVFRQRVEHKWRLNCLNTVICEVFEPSRQSLRELYEGYGIPKDFALRQKQEFVSYHRETGYKTSAWQTLFKKYVRQLWETRKHEKSTGSHRSAFEELTDTSWNRFDEGQG